MSISPSLGSIYKAASLSFGSQIPENNIDESYRDFKVYVQTKSRENEHGEPPTQEHDPGVQLKYKENSIEVQDMRNDVIETFHFDHMVNQNTSFVRVAIPLIKNTLLGQNSSIFVYDHSRFGKNQASGFYGEKLNNDSETLVGKCLKYFFDYFEMVKKNQGEKYRWGLNISLAQIYLNNIIDLLDPNKSLLNIPERENSIQTSLIKSAKVKVENVNQAFSLLNDGLFIKSGTRQSLNRISQKSHHVLTLEVYQELQQPKSQNIAKCVSQFTIVDLVYLESLGNEALSLEDKFIKSTLRALQKQFSETSLSSSQKNSTLLKYLHSCFGENKKISLLATVSSDIKENISILKFACKNSSEKNLLSSRVKAVDKLSTLQNFTQRGRNIEPSGREETMNTLRGINQTTNATERDYPIEKRKFIGNAKVVDGDLVNCLVNTMIDIKKLFLDKILDTFYIREKYIAKMIGDLQRNLEDNRNSVEKLDAKFYLKQNKLLQDIQRKFPNSPQELPKDENDILISDNVEVVVKEMKKAAEFIIESITSFGKNSINLEKYHFEFLAFSNKHPIRVKFELLKEKSERMKLDSQIQNLTLLIQTLCKQNKKLYGETVMLNYSHVRSSDRNRLYAAYQQEQNTLIESLLKEDDEVFKLQRKFDLSEFESELLNKSIIISKEKNSIGVQTDFDGDNYLSVKSAGSLTKSSSLRGNASLPFDNLRELELPSSFSRRKSSTQELTFRKRTISHSKNNWMEAQQQYALINDQDTINIHFYDEQGNEMQRGFLNVKENQNEDFDEESSSVLDEKRKTSESRRQQQRDEEEMKERNSEYDDKSVDFSIKADKPMIERDISVPSNPLDMSGPDLKFDGNIMMVDGLSQYSESPDKVFAAEESKIDVKADGEGEGLLSSKREKNNLSTEHTEIKDTKRSPRKNTTETVAKSTDHFMSPILKNVLSLTETKSHANIRDMDVSHFILESPTQSQISTNPKELLALKKLNSLKFRDRSPATILKSKSKRGRIPTQSFSLSKLSLGNLSLSLEKVDPDKYSVDARARNSTQPEEDPGQEMDIYAQNIYNTLKANQRIPTDSYRMKSKLIKFDDKPALPKLVKVAENLTPKKKKIPGLRSLKTTGFGNKKDKSNSSIEVDKSFDRSSTFE